MQTMGTPITTTTVPGGESAGMTATSAAPATPFDAVMALMTQIPGESALAPALTPNPALAPVQGAPTDGIPSVFPSFSTPATAPASVLPAVSASVVNAAGATDETGLDALMAATALAGRGITARAPAPVVTAPPLPAEIAPEDFIGPIKPSVLTADVAVPSGAATQPQELALVDMPVDPDFIGPLLPPGHASLLSSTQQAEGDGEALPLGLPTNAELAAEQDLIAADAAIDTLAQAPLGEASDLAADEVANGLLLEAEALLQPEAELSDFNQPIVPSMHSGLAQTDDAAAAPVDKGVAAAAMAHASHHAVMMQSVAKPVASTTETVDVVEIVSAIAPVSPDRAEHGSDSAPVETQASAADLESPSVDPVTLALVNALQQTAAAPVARDDAQTAMPARARADNLPPVMPLVPPRPNDQASMAPRDAALLQTMTSLSQPARAKSDIRNVAPVATTPTLSASMTPVDDASHLTQSDMQTRSSSAALSDEARRLDLPVDRLSREMASTEAKRDANSATTLALDTKLAAMVQGVTVTGAAGSDQIHSAAPTPTIMPVAMPMMHAETVTREAPSVAAIAADGRRDTQRDAEIRERQIKQQVTAALRAGSQEVRMQLYPPGLGQILIRIAMDGGKLRLSVKAGNAEAADALTQTEAGLRDALARDGFALAGFDVHDDEHKGRNNRDQAGSATTLTRAAEEGDAFSVDMTA